jgi:hypothetical protein
MHFLPCLRCGRDSVGVSLLTGATRRENVWCLAQGCEAVHYLRIGPDSGGLDVVYDRYTVGYPLETYDEGVVPPSPRSRGAAAKRLDEDGFSGSVAVYPKKRRFSHAEVAAVWRASKGRCHFCGHLWRASERGRKGWQIDHVIPNAEQAGKQTPFRLACTTCKLGKGRRPRQAHLARSIRDLVLHLTPSK